MLGFGECWVKMGGGGVPVPLAPNRTPPKLERTVGVEGASTVEPQSTTWICNGDDTAVSDGKI